MRHDTLLLVVTCIFIAGQFTEYPFVAAHLKSAAGAGASTIAILFAVYGFAGIVGSMIAAAAIDRLGGAGTTRMSLVFVTFGLLTWSLSGASLLLAGLGQAIGTTLGGWTLSTGHTNWSGRVAVTLIVIALFASIAAQRRFSA